MNAPSPDVRVYWNSYGVPVGFWINKVGARSGWTRGQVTQSCVVIADTPANLICQDVAQLWSDHGDSGSPIFADDTQASTPSPDMPAQVTELLSGGPTNDRTTTYYSPMAGVERDLGTLLVCAPAVPWTC